MTQFLKTVLPAALLAAAVSAPGLARAQCQSQVFGCQSLLGPFHEHAGAWYRAEVFEREVAKLTIQVEGGRIYRVIPCGVSTTGAPLLFNIYDRRGRLLFSTRKEGHTHKPYYDFKSIAGGQYTIVAGYEDGSGCATFLIPSRPQEEVAELAPIALGK